MKTPTSWVCVLPVGHSFHFSSTECGGGRPRYTTGDRKVKMIENCFGYRSIPSVQIRSADLLLVLEKDGGAFLIIFKHRNGMLNQFHFHFTRQEYGDFHSNASEPLEV